MSDAVLWLSSLHVYNQPFFLAVPYICHWRLHFSHSCQRFPCTCSADLLEFVEDLQSAAASRFFLICCQRSSSQMNLGYKDHACPETNMSRSSSLLSMMTVDMWGLEPSVARRSPERGSIIDEFTSKGVIGQDSRRDYLWSWMQHKIRTSQEISFVVGCGEQNLEAGLASFDQEWDKLQCNISCFSDFSFYCLQLMLWCSFFKAPPAMSIRSFNNETPACIILFLTHTFECFIVGSFVCSHGLEICTVLNSIILMRLWFTQNIGICDAFAHLV